MSKNKPKTPEVVRLKKLISIKNEIIKSQQDTIMKLTRRIKITPFLKRLTHEVNQLSAIIDKSEKMEFEAECWHHHPGHWWLIASQFHVDEDYLILFKEKRNVKILLEAFENKSKRIENPQT